MAVVVLRQGVVRAAAGRGGGGFGLSVDGLSLVKPPYGVISAINLDRGDIQWQVPYGQTADNVQDKAG